MNETTSEDQGKRREHLGALIDKLGTMSDTDLAREFEIKATLVSGLRSFFDVPAFTPAPDENPYRPANVIPESEFEDAYAALARTRSYARAAEELGMKKHTIANRARRWALDNDAKWPLELDRDIPATPRRRPGRAHEILPEVGKGRTAAATRELSWRLRTFHASMPPADLSKNAFRKIRSKRALTQNEISGRVDVSRSLWSAWEQGTRLISHDQLASITKRLSLSKDEVLEIVRWTSSMSKNQD